MLVTNTDELAQKLLGSTRSSAALAAASLLLSRYPCGERPHGALTEIADEVGVSREYVRQIAVRIGWGITPSRSRSAPKDKVCHNCGVPSERVYCLDCKHPYVECSNCGKQFRRAISQLARRVGPYYQKYYYCSIECRHEGVNKFGFLRMPRKHHVSLLAEVRKSAGLTQQDLADKIGVSKSSVVLWELGKTTLSIDSARKLTRWLKELDLTIEDVELRLSDSSRWKYEKDIYQVLKRKD